MRSISLPNQTLAEGMKWDRSWREVSFTIKIKGLGSGIGMDGFQVCIRMIGSKVNERWKVDWCWGLSGFLELLGWLFGLIVGLCS